MEKKGGQQSGKKSKTRQERSHGEQDNEGKVNAS